MCLILNALKKLFAELASQKLSYIFELAAISTNPHVEEKRMSIKTNFRHLGMTLLVFCLPVLLFIADSPAFATKS